MKKSAVFAVGNLGRPKQACSATETSYSLDNMYELMSLGHVVCPHKFFKTYTIFFKNSIEPDQLASDEAT